jgi:hypothetical protein
MGMLLQTVTNLIAHDRALCYRSLTATHFGALTMTKSDIRTVDTARKAIILGMPDFAARAISAAIRASLRAKDRAELLAIARELGVDTHSDFII